MVQRKTYYKEKGSLIFCTLGRMGDLWGSNGVRKASKKGFGWIFMKITCLEGFRYTLPYFISYI